MNNLFFINKKAKIFHLINKLLKKILTFSKNEFIIFLSNKGEFES